MTSELNQRIVGVSHTAIVCGWHLSEIRNLGFLPRFIALHIVIASAAAVPSSRSDALAMGRPVRSLRVEGPYERMSGWS